MDMPIDASLNALLGIRDPILLAPMDVLAGARLICAAKGGSTTRGIIFDLSRNNVWPAPFTGRCLINDHARRWTGREVELLQNVTTVAAEYAAAKAAGDFDTAAVIAGEAVGLIHDIPSTAEIVDRIVAEAEQILLGQRNSSAALRSKEIHPSPLIT
jgi:nitronate monooxygenase